MAQIHEVKGLTDDEKIRISEETKAMVQAIVNPNVEKQDNDDFDLPETTNCVYTVCESCQ